MESLALQMGHLVRPELQSEHSEWPQETVNGGRSVEKGLQQTGHSFLLSKFIKFKYEFVNLKHSRTHHSLLWPIGM